jgi:spermidine synthase
MASAAHASEAALARLALARLPRRRAPRVLLSGLGMGLTLRAALDALSPDARLLVVELHPVVVEWCRGPLAQLSAGAALDPRVRVEQGDVAEAIARAPAGGFDAILLDLFVGPQRPPPSDPHYGRAALARARAALAPGGVLALWAERPDAGFARRLAAAGFDVEVARPGRGGLRHAVYVAVRAPDTRGGRPRGPAARRRS